VTDLPPSVETRLANLEARVLRLESRLGTAVPAGPGEAPLDPDDTGAWLDQVAALAKQGDRAAAIALYRANLASDEQEAASFVDLLIADPPAGS
jgi:hypothetical protein